MEIPRRDISKRPILTEDRKKIRQENLLSIPSFDLPLSYEDAPLLEKGNSKTGQSSHLYDEILVWNIPALKTCPGASDWCRKCCYNGDDIVNKFPVSKWNKNLLYFMNNPNELMKRLISFLNFPERKVAVRIHSSGDFFSNEYTDFWIKIIELSPNTLFWAYTRSWTIDFLLPKLNDLRSLNNIQLFASWDNTMKDPPKNWRLSVVYDQGSQINFSGLVCPEQSGLVPNCATCNYCIKKGTGNVNFIIH